MPFNDASESHLYRGHLAVCGRGLCTAAHPEPPQSVDQPHNAILSAQCNQSPGHLWHFLGVYSLKKKKKSSEIYVYT